MCGIVDAAGIRDGRGNLYDGEVVDACARLLMEKRFTYVTAEPVTPPGVFVVGAENSKQPTCRDAGFAGASRRRRMPQTEVCA